MAELLRIYPENPNEREIQKVVDCLKNGGIIIYPTDTIYGIGCDMYNNKAVENLAKIKGQKAAKANLSLICFDLSHISEFAKQVDTPTFKLMKKALPGPYTFILNANNNIPKIFKGNKKEIGLRVPDNNIARKIVQVLGHPIVNMSIHDEDEIIEYTTDPELIYEKYKEQVDIVINGGFGNNEASTVINCTSETPVVIRQGLGDISQFL